MTRDDPREERLPRMPSRDAWSKAWQETWSKVGTPGYELPQGGPGGKIGPFPLILMGADFWRGMRRWAQSMMREGVFAHDEIGFGYVTDSPQKAVELIVAGLHPSVRERLAPLT